MSSNYTIKSGDNLWKIARQQFGLTNNTEIANKVNEIAKANHLKSANSIFVGSKLDLGNAKSEVGGEKATPEEMKLMTKPSATDSTEVPADKAVAPFVNYATSSIGCVDNTPVTESAKPKEAEGAVKSDKVDVVNDEKTTPFGNWTNKCAESITDVDATGNPVYGSDVEDFNMAGPKFRKAVENKNYDKAGEVYKQNALKTAKGEVESYDTDGDGMISPQEQVKKEAEDFEKKFGKMDAETLKNSETTARKANMFMDLDKNGKVDEKEYASFLMLMDSNNDKKQADGKISRDEYVKTASFFENHLNQDNGKFRGTDRAYYKSMFGVDPAAK